jgi:hypothetical protein
VVEENEVEEEEGGSLGHAEIVWFCEQKKTEEEDHLVRRERSYCLFDWLIVWVFCFQFFCCKNWVCGFAWWDLNNHNNDGRQAGRQSWVCVMRPK